MRLLRVYHAGRLNAQQGRERALVKLGHEVHLVVPSEWPGEGAVECADGVHLHQVRVTRTGDVNRHRFARGQAVNELIRSVAPDVLDIQEEPFSAVVRQLRPAMEAFPTVMYSAQNIDKRFPPPYAWYERAAFSRVRLFYPCSRQAASVLRGKGFRGPIEILPLGYDPAAFHPAPLEHSRSLRIAYAGRLVPEKGVEDLLRAVAACANPAWTVEVFGDGPSRPGLERLASQAGIAGQVRFRGNVSDSCLAAELRRTHVLVAPSKQSATWAEQFGRVLIEGAASGCAVIAYASGAIPDVAQPFAASLVAEGDVLALASALVRIAESANAWSAARAASLAATQQFTWHHIALASMKLYARATHIASSTPAPASAATRMAAIGEFGPPAQIRGEARVFALPILRNHPRVSHALGALVDRLTGQA